MSYALLAVLGLALLGGALWLARRLGRSEGNLAAAERAAGAAETRARVEDELGSASDGELRRRLLNGG